MLVLINESTNTYIFANFFPSFVPYLIVINNVNFIYFEYVQNFTQEKIKIFKHLIKTEFYSSVIHEKFLHV